MKQKSNLPEKLAPALVRNGPDLCIRNKINIFDKGKAVSMYIPCGAGGRGEKARFSDDRRAPASSGTLELSKDAEGSE